MCGTAVADSPHVTQMFGPDESRLLCRALAAGLNAPVTTSAGRLFDAVAALLGLCERMTYEGQAAMALEAAVDEAETGWYPMPLGPVEARHVLVASWSRPRWLLDWEPMVLAVMSDRAAGTPVGSIAARVHDARPGHRSRGRATGRASCGPDGRLFQNRILTERTVAALEGAGFRPCWHQRVPPNDGGLALGQVRPRRGSVPRRTRRSAPRTRHSAPRTRRSAPRTWHRTQHPALCTLHSSEVSPCVSQSPARS